jgi:hypothetical protein
MDTLLAGTLFPLQRVHCVRVNVQHRLAVEIIPGLIVKTIPGTRENPFTFPPESLFTISPESFSSSSRNTFHVRPGNPFTLSRNPQTGPNVTRQAFAPAATPLIRTCQREKLFIMTDLHNWLNHFPTGSRP